MSYYGVPQEILLRVAIVLTNSSTHVSLLLEVEISESVEWKRTFRVSPLVHPSLHHRHHYHHHRVSRADHDRSTRFTPLRPPPSSSLFV